MLMQQGKRLGSVQVETMRMALGNLNICIRTPSDGKSLLETSHHFKASPLTLLTSLCGVD